MPAQSQLILSIFPNIGLLDRGFEDEGYCVVRGPDLLWGGDIRKFNPPSGKFWGLIGGPPCQAFSGLNRDPDIEAGLEMLNEFTRCVTEAKPEWWLMENVARVPDVTVPGYVTQRFDINQAWYDPVSRLRHIQFGSLSGRLLHIDRAPSHNTVTDRCALASDSRDWRDLAQLQGLPPDFDLPPFTVKAKKQAIGNGVPYSMAIALARSVTLAWSVTNVTDQAHKHCGCGCGRWVTGKAKYYDYSCRKRAQRNRDKAAQIDRVWS